MYIDYPKFLGSWSKYEYLGLRGFLLKLHDLVAVRIIGVVGSGVVTVKSLKLIKVCSIFSEARFCAYYYRS